MIKYTFILIMSLAIINAYIPQRDANQAAIFGAYTFNALPEPQTVSDCANDDVQIQIFDFVSYFLKKADSATISQILTLQKELDEFILSLPQEYKDCLYNNEEVQQICVIYGITKTTTEEEIRKQIVNYAMSHFIATKKVIHSANTHWNGNREYFEAGFELAELGKKALKYITIQVFLGSHQFDSLSDTELEYQLQEQIRGENKISQQVRYPHKYEEQFKGTPKSEYKCVNDQFFEFQYIIGIGGFGRVWKVTFKSRIYAMKEMSKALVLFKKSVHSVMNELSLLSTLRHPFIVNVVTAFQDNSNLFLVLDFLEGGDLRYHLGRIKRFSEIQTKFFIACILVGLEHLHSHKIIHRDIKPENLVLDNRGYVRITDLGVARYLTAENAQDTSGTPGYMAPEVMCRMNHSYPVDYFALGVICYEFMLGKRPYNGGSRKEIRDQMIARQIQIKNKPDNWSLEAIDFTNRLLQRKPGNRLLDCRNHIWFKNFPWDKLINRELKSPFVPLGGDNFDQVQIQYEDEENQQIILLNQQLVKENQHQFEGYSFQRESRKSSQKKSLHLI